MKTLLIDNYDSYTFNLFQLLAEVNGEHPLVIRNDQLSFDELKTLDFDNIVISPGPGRPENQSDFGVCRQVLSELNIPTLGVCLGHQGLGMVNGAKVVHAPTVMHGQLSAIQHNDDPLFTNILQGFRAVRYHSLMVAEPLPNTLEKIAWGDDGVIMALRHRQRPQWSVQFHPESISAEYGKTLVENFRDLTESARSTHLRRSSLLKHETTSSEKHPPRGISNKSVVPYRQKAQPQKSSYTVRYRKLNQLYNTEQVFHHLYRHESNAFWLDSSRVEASLSRFSFMGAGEAIHYSLGEGESIFDFLERELAEKHTVSPDLPFDFNTGFVGYLGYELKAELGADEKYRSNLPDASFIFASRLLAFDHLKHGTYLCQLVPVQGADDSESWFDTVETQLEQLPPIPELTSQSRDNETQLEFHLQQPRFQYIDVIRQSQSWLTEGESYEICLTTQMSVDVQVDAFTLYRHLRKNNPAPYAAYLRFGDVAILSSSPERFLKIDRDGWAEAKPIKGTVRRGRDVAEDVFLREELRTSEKTRAENLMIVDLLRNDLGLVCEVGSVHVPKLMDVETYATVHQLVSTIRGRLRDDLGVVDAVRAAFPGGSMTGAPKLRTMKLIDELEVSARGVYSGAIGFFGVNGTADLNIVIRTIVSAGGRLTMGAGGAITILSDADEEYAEMLLKADALVKAIVEAVRGEFGKNGYKIVG